MIAKVVGKRENTAQILWQCIGKIEPPFLIYKDFLKEPQIEKISYSIFSQNRPYFVKPFIKHECCCPLCQNYFTATSEQRARLQSKYDKHIQIYQEQFAYYKD